jgi:Fe-S oxidoreductase
MGKSSPKSYIDAFRFDDCVECGECLSSCKYMGISEEESIDAVRKLRQGADADTYLDKCTFCAQCNDRCPVDARPAALMLERLRDRRKAEGSIPQSVAYYFAGIEGLGATENYFKDVYSASSEETKAIIREWSEPKQCEDLLWCGCANRMTPQNIEYSKVLADLPKFGGVSDCCGVNEAKAGLYEAARHVTDNLLEKLSKSRFRRLVVSCGSCQEYLTLLYPEYFGGSLPFEVISLYEYIEEQMAQGKVSVQRQVDLDMAISDSCYGYRFGNAYMNTARKLCEAIGIRTVELAHNREDTACCGVSGLARRFRMGDVTDAMRLKAADIRESGMEHVLNYCMGCHTMSAMVHEGRSHYLLEKVLWALGDDMTSSIHIPREAREKAKVRFQDQGRFYLPAI